MGKFLKDINLKNKVAVVTGATKGIGRATTIALHQVGDICSLFDFLLSSRHDGEHPEPHCEYLSPIIQ